MPRPRNTDVKVRGRYGVLLSLHPRAEWLVRRGVADSVMWKARMVIAFYPLCGRDVRIDTRKSFPNQSW